MIFGGIKTSEAAGSILAHSLLTPAGLFKKGRLLTPADVETLLAAGIGQLVAVRLEAGDVAENEAASLLAAALTGTGLMAQAAFTGRVNIYAAAGGLLQVDAEAIAAFNSISETITVATMPRFQRLAPRQMVATVKIIPFAVRKQVLETCIAAAAAAEISLQPFMSLKVGLILSEMTGTKASLTDKAEQSMRQRVEGLGGRLSVVKRVPHVKEALAQAMKQVRGECDLVLLFGASAIVDRGDVIPQALLMAGGRVERLGMPVDPGNLLMLGRLGDHPVVGVPSCARSPKVNGFDWVLERLFTEKGLSAQDIASMGAGGLLAEINSRPSPREGRATPPSAPRVAAILLGAGRSHRMGHNKLTADFAGKPMIRHMAELLATAGLDDLILVTGHECKDVTAAIAGLPFRLVHNADYAEGLSSSLRAGLASLPSGIEAAFLCLGDMPLVGADILQGLIAAFNPLEHRSIVIPLFEGQRGNPVLWGRQHFKTLSAVTGDQGGRVLFKRLEDEIADVAVLSDAVLHDVDTPEALALLRRQAGLNELKSP